MTKPETSAYFRSMISVIVAHVVVAHDRDLAAIPQELTYVPYLVAVSFLSYFIWILIARITVHLNLKYDWVEDPIQRFVLQGVASGMTPVLLMLTVIGFLACFFYSTRILTADFLVHQLMTSGTFVLFVNLLFFLRYLKKRMEEARRILQRDFPDYSNLRF